MSKKIISIVLAVMLAFSMVAVAAVSVSAQIDTHEYEPTTTDTYRYWFIMPSDWYNEYGETAGIYWWTGTDGADPWPGYPAKQGDMPNVYYMDVPTDVTAIIWNNAFNGGEDAEAPEYTLAVQTTDIGSEYYDEGESELYPEGTENFDGMVYVVNPNLTVENPLNGKLTYGGEWYYYYGNGEYGTAKDKADAEVVYNTDYQPPKEPQPTEPQPTEPEPEPTTEAPTTEAPTTEAPTTVAPTTGAPATPDLTVIATSNYFPEATAVYNAETNEVKVTYLFSSEKKIVNTQAKLDYDVSVLTLSDKSRPYEDEEGEEVVPAFPVFSDAVCNYDKPGQILFNASRLKLYNFTSEKVYCEFIFDVNPDALPTATTLNLTVLELTASETIDGKPVDTSVVTDSIPQSLSFATTNATKLTDSTWVEPTTVAPAPTTAEPTVAPTTVEPTAAPTTVAPTTAAPTTAAPTTAAPTTAAPKPTVAPTTAAPKPTVAPTTAEPTTVDPSAPTEATTVVEPTTTPDQTSTQAGPSTSDTPVKPDNNAIQTGSSSLAVIILALLVVSTGVMFVIRKRENF